MALGSIDEALGPSFEDERHRMTPPGCGASSRRIISSDTPGGVHPNRKNSLVWLVGHLGALTSTCSIDSPCLAALASFVGMKWQRGKGAKGQRGGIDVMFLLRSLCNQFAFAQPCLSQRPRAGSTTPSPSAPLPLCPFVPLCLCPSCLDHDQVSAESREQFGSAGGNEHVVDDSRAELFFAHEHGGLHGDDHSGLQRVGTAPQHV